MTVELASSKGSILIVDDSPENLRVLSSTLARQDYVVRCVTNSQMALISVQNFPPDLILLDIRMPIKNGFEFCQELKADPQTRDIPIIFLSALSEVEDVVKAFQVGGVDYITKPFKTEEVLARIDNQLTIQKLRTKLVEQNQTLKQEIDERKKVEVALRQEIQSRIMIEIALQDAKEAAAAASDAKSKFLSQMSHELRTPLNAILGFTDLLQQENSLTSQHKEYLKTIHQSGHHLLQMINNILSITSNESSQLMIHRQLLDLHHFLDTVVVLWRSKAADKGVQLTLERAAKVPRYIYTDERKLRQILMNLLENAWKFTQQGFVKVSVTAEFLKAGNQPAADLSCLLQFTIEDSGSGIALQEIDHLFQVFSQAELLQGVGLGLVISHQFIQLMGGTLTLNSVPGEGTVVHFQLPVQVTQDTSLPAQSSEAEPAYELSAPVEETLTGEALLNAMPIEWITQLHHAAIRGFDQQILSLIQQIPGNYAPLAKTLANWTCNFQFERIEQLTGQVMGQ